MPKAKCPSCATVVTYAAGYDPICPTCGFRGQAPVAAAPATWATVPGPQAVAGPVHASAPTQAVVLARPAPVAYVRVAPPGNGLATASLVLGIVGAVLFWVPGVGAILGLLAVALGLVPMVAADDPQRPSQRGMAIAGVVLGAVVLLLNLGIWNDAFDPDW